MNNEKIINPHPGEILLEEFLKPMDLSQNRLAMELRVPCHRVHEIVHGRRGITADTALRLAKFFGTTPDFWMNLQKSYDLAAAKESLGIELTRIQTLDALLA
ncbi:MAG: HigA family addiction module antidote protein [Lentisphaerae bacterium]|jgi:addiction module HigA family antidote|nr:HigA family addiction module antidote protein [Lentisphaerota bacterium]